ncbi:AGAP000675-PC-like protein [Anopheles sinensis]|uniref:AGAP000675-PC-like protein n=1 Tax=Anopheles sinensis TaxID=74873 RepID=A0A084VAD0_ANOSI|nr:AGAP000675-PC-like protein [Anopheles sinensis]
MFRPQLKPSETIREKMRIFERTDAAQLDERPGVTNRSFGYARGSEKRREKSTGIRNGTDGCLLEGSDADAGMMPPINSNPNAMTDAQGLILPKKLVNPVLESMDRQNLHRELMFNQKMYGDTGKSVLNQKSELQRALEKQKERQVLTAQNLAKQTEQSIASELGRVIMQRAQRLEQQKAAGANGGPDATSASINPEYLNARAKLRATVDTK